MPVNKNDVFEFVFRQANQDSTNVGSISFLWHGEASWVRIHHTGKSIGDHWSNHRVQAWRDFFGDCDWRKNIGSIGRDSVRFDRPEWQ